MKPTTAAWFRLSASAGVLLALFASGAAAEAFYYHEVERAGIVYVFSSADSFARWEASDDEVDGGITRAGYGPEGKTVVFDAERAVALYNFRHGLPGEDLPDREPDTPAKLRWSGGKTTLELDGARLVLSNRLQFRWTRLDADDVIDSRGSFRIRRAKTKLQASVFSPHLQFTLQLNWASTANSLEDAYLAWDASKTGALQIRLGQFKAPFGRQEMTSSGSQQFVDRSSVSSEFAKGRDIGVQAFGRTRSGRFEYFVGVFNGNGVNRVVNDNDSYQFDARVVWNPNGDPKVSEVDFESSDRPLWSLAAGYEYNNRRLLLDDVPEFQRSTWGVDGVFKYRGVFLTAEGYLRRMTPESGDAFDSDGYFLQGGYRFATRWELAGRWGWWDRNATVADDERTELAGALSYYHAKHALKVQADLRRLEVGDRASHELRVQTQFAF